MQKMSAFDETNVEKKFQSAVNSLDSIQSLSQWVLSHKAQHEKIVSIWLKVFKAARVELKIALFNLCNEIVQTCRRKHAIVYKDAYKEVLKDAAVLARSANIKSNVERIFKIWFERHIYDEVFVKELLAILNCTKVDATLSSKLLADFVPSKLIRVLDMMVDTEEENEMKRLSLPDKLWDSAEIEAIKNQLKDRQQGNEFLAHLDISRSEFDNYVATLGSEMKERKELVSMLEQGQIYYDTQRGEATLIATAYKNFTSRVTHQRKKLADTRIYLPDPFSAQDSPEEPTYPKKMKLKENTSNEDWSPFYGEENEVKEKATDDVYKKRDTKTSGAMPLKQAEYCSKTSLPYITFAELPPTSAPALETPQPTPPVNFYSAPAEHYPQTSPIIYPPLPTNMDNSDGGATPVQDEDSLDETQIGSSLQLLTPMQYTQLQAAATSTQYIGTFAQPVFGETYPQYTPAGGSFIYAPSVAMPPADMEANKTSYIPHSPFMLQNAVFVSQGANVPAGTPFYASPDMSKPPPNFAMPRQQVVFAQSGANVQPYNAQGVYTHGLSAQGLRADMTAAVDNRPMQMMQQRPVGLVKRQDSSPMLASPPPVFIRARHAVPATSPDYSPGIIRTVFGAGPQEVQTIKSHISKPEGQGAPEGRNGQFNGVERGNKIESIASRVDRLIESVRNENFEKEFNEEGDDVQHSVRSNLTVINTVDELAYDSPQHSERKQNNGNTLPTIHHVINMLPQLPAQTRFIRSMPPNMQPRPRFIQERHASIYPHRTPFYGRPDGPRLLFGQHRDGRLQFRGPRHF